MEVPKNFKDLRKLGVRNIVNAVQCSKRVNSCVHFFHTLRHIYGSVWPTREAKPRFGTVLVRCAHVCETGLFGNHPKHGTSPYLREYRRSISTYSKTSEFHSMLLYRVMDLDRRRSVLWCSVLPHPPADHYISMQTEAEISKPDEVRHNKPIGDFRVDFRLFFKARPCAKSFIWNLLFFTHKCWFIYTWINSFSVWKISPRVALKQR